MNALSTTLPALYATIAPIFLVIASGFLAVRFGLLTKDHVRALAAYVANVAAPVMIFSAIAGNDVASLGQPGYLAAYALGSGLAFCLCWFSLRRFTRTEGAALAFGALGGSFGNSLMVGFPLAVLLFGDAAAIALALTLLVEVAVMLPLTLTLADASQTPDKDGRSALVQNALNALRNPLIIAMVFGAVAAAVGANLPAPVETGIDMLSRTVAPVGLFVIGGLIVGYVPAGDALRQAIVVPSKLIVHPAAVCAGMWVFGVRDPVLVGAALCFSASPIFGAYAALSQRYQFGAQGAALMIATTVCAAVSMPVVLWALARLFMN